jgi:hypothetical protein
MAVGPFCCQTEQGIITQVSGKQVSLIIQLRMSERVSTLSPSNAGDKARVLSGFQDASARSSESIVVLRDQAFPCCRQLAAEYAIERSTAGGA